MRDYFSELDGEGGGRVSKEEVEESMGSLEEEDRERMVDWGLGLAREKGWRECSCVARASREMNTSLGEQWREEGGSPLGEAGRRRGEVEEAVPGWCEVPGCKTQFTYFMITVGIISILGATGRSPLPLISAIYMHTPVFPPL